MKRILIVEDSQDKVKALCSIISTVSGLENCDIKRVSSIMEATTFLSTEQVDVMILDLVIPWRLFDEAKPENAISFLEILRDRKSLNKPLVVIGTTEHDDALKEWQQKFEEGLWFLLATSEGNLEWEGRLRMRLSYLIESLEQWRSVSMHRSSVDVCIITAVAIETESIHREFSPQILRKDNDCSVYYRTSITNFEGKELSILCVESGCKGMTAAAAITTKVIYEFRPRFILMSGIAAGVSGKSRIGDLLVPVSMIDYVSGKIRASEGEEESFAGDASVLNISQKWKGLMTDLARDRELLSKITDNWPSTRPHPDPHLVVGPIASGSAVIQSKTRITELLDRYRDVIGIDMEAYGVLHASQSVGGPIPEMLCFKAVSDLGDASKNDQWQTYAAYLSARFSREFIFRYVS